ncbi:lectin-like protein [Eubacterium limosum]|uniref:lectin-like protein n=1 Tax=Eubacterium limosum TaxID=1736 RepID=UPI0022E9869D|nr:lectin-like protein [Eubacterium limosum]
MKKIVQKSLISILTVSVIFAGILVFPAKIQAATFDDINQPDVFLKQDPNECTLTAAAMMMRRTAIMYGDTTWRGITQNAIRSAAWSGGLKHNFEFGYISVAKGYLPTGNANIERLIQLLNEHPEGIVLYKNNINAKHAVLLTDYTNGTFYCADPAKAALYGRIRLDQACNREVTETNANEYWYVSSPDVNLTPTDTTPPTISEVKITDQTSEGYTVTCRVTDVSGVIKVMFPTWTEANGQDDLMGGDNWENMPGLCGATNGEYATFRVHDTDHSYEKGRYNTYIYAWDQYGNRAGPVTLAVDLAIKNEPVAVTYFQGNKYMLMEDAFGWKDAKSKCEELGGHLVTITSESEQNIVADLLKKGQRISYAMGMTDEKEEGVYKWVTGEKYSFSNWAPSEPNNHNDNENASLIYNQSGYGGEQIAYHGSWNDTAISTITGYICEIENDKKASATVNWNDHDYELYEDFLTWDEAQKRCKELGGHLVTITSQEEQDAVIGLQKKGKKENYYIGLSDTSQEGNFQWVTGETTNFSLWESGQPDNWQGNENYVHLMPDGKWNDVERNQRYGFICEYDGMESSPQIMYQTHTEGFGWLNWVTDGAMSGTTGEGRRVEAVKIQAAESNLGVRYRTWVSSRGWTNWSEDGALSGTEGSGLPVEAIDIELMGADKDKYDLYYKTHTGNFGWLDWAKNGQHAGTLGYGYQIEALEIVLIPKNGTPPGRTDVPLKSQNYVEPPVISDIKVTNRSRSGYTVSCKVSSEIGIRKIMFPTWTVNNGQDDLSDSWPSIPEYQGTADQNTITFHVNARDHNNEQGFYSTHIYAWDENGGVTKAFLDPVLVSEAANKGDLNADGKVDIMDARKAKRAAMKEITLSESEFAAADLNGDGKVDIMEARKIKRAAMKEIELN